MNGETYGAMVIAVVVTVGVIVVVMVKEWMEKQR